MHTITFVEYRSNRGSIKPQQLKGTPLMINLSKMELAKGLIPTNLGARILLGIQVKKVVYRERCKGRRFLRQKANLDKSY